MMQQDYRMNEIGRSLPRAYERQTGKPRAAKDINQHANDPNSAISPGIAAFATESDQLPAWVRWLTFAVLGVLIVGLSVTAQVRNDYIVAWSLSQGIIGEASTQGLGSFLANFATAGVILGLAVASLSIPPVARAAGFMLRSGRVGVSGLGLGAYAIAQAIVALLARVRLGVAAAVQAIAAAMARIWLVVEGVARAVAPVLARVRLGVAGVIGHLWTGTAILLGYVGLAIRGVVRGVGLVVYYSLGGLVIALYYLVDAVLRYVWPVVSSAAVRLWLGITVTVGAVSAIMGYGWQRVSAALHQLLLGITVIAGAVGSAVGGTWAIIAVAAVNASARASTAVRYVWALVSTTTALLASVAAAYLTRRGGELSRNLRLSSTTVARGGHHVRGYSWSRTAAVAVFLWLGVTTIAQAVGHLLVYAAHRAVALTVFLWLGVATIGLGFGAVLGHGWHAAGALASYVGRAISTTARAVNAVFLPVRRTVAAILRYFGRGIAMIARAIGVVLRAASQSGAAGLGYLDRGVAVTGRAGGTVFLAVLRAVAAVLGYFGRGIAIMARAAGVALGYVLGIVAVVAGYFGRGIAMMARAAGVVLASVLGVVATAAGYFGRGIAMMARAAGVVLASVLGVVATVAGYFGRGIAVIARAVGAILGYASGYGSSVLRHLALGMATLGHHSYVAGGVAKRQLTILLRLVWLGVSTAARLLWLGVATFASRVRPLLYYLFMGLFAFFAIAGWALWAGVLRPLWLGVSATAGFLWLGVATIAGRIWLGASKSAYFAWLGITTTVLAFGWVVSRGATAAARGLWRSAAFAAGTLGTGISATPDAVGMALWVVKHRKGVSTLSEFNLTRERALSVIATLWVFGIGGLIAVALLWPGPPEPTVVVDHWVTGHLYFGANLPDIAERYNAAGHRTEAGKRIVVQIHNAPSSEGARALLGRVTGGGPAMVNAGAGLQELPDPTIVTPSGAHWLVSVNHGAGRKVVDPDNARSLALAYIGIITFRDIAECLGWPQKEIGYADIIALRNDPRGWKSYSCAKPSWGTRPLVAFTDPRTSSTGRSVLIALYSIAAGKLPGQLTLDDIKDPAVVSYVEGFQQLIDHYFIGTTVMNTKIYKGARFGQFFIMPEDNLIHLYEGTARARFGTKTHSAPPIKDPMVMIYPKEGSMARTNCACIVDAAWVTAEHVEAAEKWTDFLLEDEQQRLLMAAGFRPTAGLTVHDPSSKITPRFGLNPATPAKPLNPAMIAPEVAAAIDASWEEVKRPGIMTFVLDTSGSMVGTKLRQAKEGLNLALDSMASNNQVGFLSFGNTVHTQSSIPVAPLADVGPAIVEAVEVIRARGETALYDAVKRGIEMTDAAEGDPDAIRGVVVLTDGLANRGATRLDDLIKMFDGEAPIREFGGFEGDSVAVRNDGRSVPLEVTVDGKIVDNEQFRGDGLAIHTEHRIQVFFIGIGEDLKLTVGRLLAEATFAEFQGVTEEDLASLLQELSGYF